ncbi:MAG: excinuclease ABC subunit B [Jannaschia sp.]
MHLAVPFLWLLMASPALAWSFSYTPICTIDGAGPVPMRVTFDPATGVYGLRLTRTEGWPDAAVLSIQFENGAPLTISTDRHRIDGPYLEVTDSGFGNVLRGMALNETATVRLGALALPINLTGAAGPVADFRACPQAATS